MSVRQSFQDDTGVCIYESDFYINWCVNGIYVLIYGKVSNNSNK